MNFRRISTFIIVFSLLLSFQIGFAHPGDTDSNGGHWNHSTGEYHYHHGYPAHQHTGGVCPYAFDDKTGQNSGSSSNGASTKTAANVTSATPPSSSSGHGWMVYVGIAILYLIYWLIKEIQTARVNAKKAAEEKQELLRLYSGKTKHELACLCGMPHSVELGEDGLPKDIYCSGWGPSYTFFISPSGETFHNSPRCNKSAQIPCHASQLHGRRPCKRCSPHAPNLSWYRSYLDLLARLKRHGIPTAPEHPFICGTALLRAEEQNHLSH